MGAGVLDSPWDFALALLCCVTLGSTLALSGPLFFFFLGGGEVGEGPLPTRGAFSESRSEWLMSPAPFQNLLGNLWESFTMAMILGVQWTSQR